METAHRRVRRGDGDDGLYGYGYDLHHDDVHDPARDHGCGDDHDRCDHERRVLNVYSKSAP